MTPSPFCERLALGTAQLGLAYGIANRSGRIKLDEAKSILTHAHSLGIRMLDTAVAYGDSEARFGSFGVSSWSIITKLPKAPLECNGISRWVIDSVENSLSRLKVDQVYGVLLHSPSQLLEPEGEEIYRALVALKEQGKMQKIGISIYSPEELDALCPRFQFDLVQAPYNAIDQRLVVSGWLKRLNEAQVEVHARSIFLQGLLLMPPSRRPPYFEPWSPVLNGWFDWLQSSGLSAVKACVGFVLSRPEISRIVIGVDNERQLDQLISSLSLIDGEPLAQFACDDLDLLMPSRWNIK